jgi:hypothetical protein
MSGGKPDRRLYISGQLKECVMLQAVGNKQKIGEHSSQARPKKCSRLQAG